MSTRTFSRDGVRFQYPTNWLLEAESAGDGDAPPGDTVNPGDLGDPAGWAVTVTSPATAFATVALRPDAGSPAQLVSEALDALKAEYPELETEPATDTLSGRPAAGFDFDFLAVDTTVTGWVRAVDTGAGPVVVLCQVGEYDRERNEPVLRAVCASLAVPS